MVCAAAWARVPPTWTRYETSASGQVFEFRVWALLTEQSHGQLHVFLPLTDRESDGLEHRLTDGTFFRVHAKSRSTLMAVRCTRGLAGKRG